MTNKNLFFLFFAVMLSAFLVIGSCKKIKVDAPVEMPDNPYDSIPREDTSLLNIPIDSLNITYVHDKVLAARCALPACHVGSFEPDFRTPQSSFSTLVYSPIKKNNAAKSFKFRVVPYDVAKSVLYERVSNCCFIYSGDQMPQDNDTLKLSAVEKTLIARWIENGARDMFGNVAPMPNEPPLVVPYYLAVSTDYTIEYSRAGNRADSLIYNPFIVPQNVSLFYVGVQVTDDNLAYNQLQYNKLKISTNQDNFSGAAEFTGTPLSVAGFTGWIIPVPTSLFPVNDTLFMRYYVNDGAHLTPSEFPRTDVLFVYKTYWSFIRQ